MTNNSPSITDQFTTDFIRYAVGSIVPAIIGIFAIIILTRAFTPNIYGQYALAMVFVTVLATISSGWIGQSILRLEPEYETDTLLSNALVALLFSIVVFLTLAVTAYTVFPFLRSSYQWLFLSGAALVIAEGIFSVVKAVFQARLESRKAVLLRVSRSVGRLSLGLPLAVLILHHPAGWIFGGAIATLLSTAFIWRHGLRYSEFSVQYSTILRMVSFGFPMIGWLLGFNLLTYIDRVLLGIIVDTRTVGLYTSNYKIANSSLPLALAPVTRAAHSIIMSQWDGDNITEVRRVVTEMTRYFLIIGSPATVLIVFSGDTLSTLLLDQRYQAGSVIIPIIAIGVFLWHLAMLTHKGFEVRDKTRMMLVGVLLATVLNVILNLLLIPKFGYEGAAVATLLSFIAYFLFAMVLVEKYLPWRPPLLTVRNVVLACSSTALCVYLVYANIDGTIPSLLIATIIGTAIYLVSLFVLGEFSKREISMARTILREGL